MSNDFDRYWTDRLRLLFRLYRNRRPELLAGKDGAQRINQSAVAAKCGIEQSTVGRIFHGETKPRVDTLATLAEPLGMDLAEFFNHLFGTGEVVVDPRDDRAIAFRNALAVLSGEQLDYLVGKINTMLEAKRMAAEDPEFYRLTYGDDGQK